MDTQSNWQRPIIWLIAFSWLNVFGLSWLVVLRWAPVDLLTGLIWSLFFILAFAATLVDMAEREKREKRD